MQEVRLSTGEYTSIYDRQITTLILAKRYSLESSDRPQQLTHMLLFPIIHPTAILLCCGVEIVC